MQLVRNCLPALLSLLRGGHLDLVFANEEEAAALAVAAGVAGADAGHEEKVGAAQDLMLQHVQVSVVSRGPHGCSVRARDGASAGSGADRVTVVDTIGAGDCFTAGFLHAYLKVGVCVWGCCGGGCGVFVAYGGGHSPKVWWQRLRGMWAWVRGNWAKLLIALAVGRRSLKLCPQSHTHAHIQWGGAGPVGMCTYLPVHAWVHAASAGWGPSRSPSPRPITPVCVRRRVGGAPGAVCGVRVRGWVRGSAG